MSYDFTYRLRNVAARLQGPVDDFGEQALFYGQTVRYVPNALTRYRKETIRLIAEMTLGAGALVMIGGTVGVAAFLTLASGGVIAVQGSLFDDGTGARLCEALAESYPPRCGGDSIPISGYEESITVPLSAAQGVTWTDQLVSLLGEIIDGTLVVSPPTS